ncbi:hypothetical protein F4778DRAFT_386779 [Xylariomycetidae sp. FL2044]|nr:hypothetical protein F4778DRAFT_386779 [Xylariomycetidae sp. FL2044]
MSQNAHGSEPPRGHLPSSQSRSLSSSQTRQLNYSSNDSQGTAATTTTTTNDTDRVFSPTASDSEGSAGLTNGNSSSQESHLLQLSRLAASQQKLTQPDQGLHNGGQSKKRMADGMVKPIRESSSTSPVRMGHSRNTSTVSMASTTGSRIGELSAELKAKLSYAMVKVNNGWQGHSIDEVESLASQAASPTSSSSTLYGRNGASASPRLALGSERKRASSTVTSPVTRQPSNYPYDFSRTDNSSRVPPAISPISQVPTLAPPAPIQPRQSAQPNPRRNSNVKYTPAYLSHPHHASPHSPAQPSPLQSTPGQSSMRTHQVDPILFSPHQNVREQEALETLMFMSSPGNSANMKHNLPSSQTSQPRNNGRTALPTSRLGHNGETNSQGRKSLPTARPQFHHAPPVKRVGFEKSPGGYNDMEIDDPYGSPQVRGTPRRKTVNGTAPRPSLSLPAGLGGPARNRPKLKEDDIERMLERAAANDSSDSEGEIQLPYNGRRNGAGVGV